MDHETIPVHDPLLSILQAFDRLSPDDQGKFLVEALIDTFKGGVDPSHRLYVEGDVPDEAEDRKEAHARLISSFETTMSKMESPRSFAFFKHLTEGAYAPTLLNNLARNPYISPETMDWLIDRQVANILYLEKEAFTPEQFTRIVRTYPLTHDLTKHIQKGHSLIPQDDLWELALRALEQLKDDIIGKGFHHEVLFDTLLRADKPTSPDVLAAMWPKLRLSRGEQILKHPNCPDSILMAGIETICDPNLKEELKKKQGFPLDALLSHPRVPEEYLWFLHNDLSFWPHLAKNPGLPVEVQDLMLRSDNLQVLTGLLYNPSLDPRKWNKLLQQVSKTIETRGELKPHAFMRAPQCDLASLKLLWDNEGIVTTHERAIAYFKAKSADTAFRMILLSFSHRQSWGESFRFDLADLWPELLDYRMVTYIADRAQGTSYVAQQTRLRLIKHPEISLSYILDWEESEDPVLKEAVRARIAENPYVQS